jgi:protein O-mannosyl-transferase
MADLRSRPVAALAVFGGILCLTFAAYGPVVHAGWVWDDDSWITENPAVQDPHGLHAIWTSVPRMQYYPLTFTTFWVEHRLHGFEPLGYHLANVFLHAANAFLVGLILSSLGVPGAYWVAALFAVHPVHVESVAWVTERKNVLSGLFCLGSALAYLDFERERRPARYALALALFACALLSKTTSATLPAALAVVAAWRKWPPRARDLAPLLPFVLLALTLASVTVVLERGMVSFASPDFRFTPSDRVLIAARSLLFYPFKLLVPYPLIFNYPRFDVETASAAAFWPVPVVALAAAALAFAWRRGRRGVPCAVLVYVAMIFPALGFFDVYAFRFSFVADHFQYLASIGILALWPLSGAWLLRKLEVGRAFRTAARALGAGVVLILAVLTWNQAGAYRDEATLWEDTIAKNPDSWIAHHSLARLRTKSGQLDAAIAGFNEAIRCKPSSVESYTGRGLAHGKQGRLDLAIADLDHAVALDDGYPEAFLDRGEVLVDAGRYADAIRDLDRFLASNPRYAPAYRLRAEAWAATGRHDRAIADLDVAIGLGTDPTAYRDRAMAHVQRAEDAAALDDLTRAIELTPDSAELRSRRGFVLVRLGRYDAALAEFDAAASADPNLALTFVLRGGLFQRMDGNTTRACGEWQHACRLGDCKLYDAECKRGDGPHRSGDRPISGTPPGK